HRARALADGRLYRLLGQHVDNGLLEGGGDLGHGRGRALVVPHEVQDRRLEAAEREVVAAAQPGAREPHRRPAGAARGALDRRAAGEAEAEQAADLVERLSGGVVARLAEAPV